MLSRESFFSAAAPQTKIIKIPDWQDPICIRQISAGQSIEFQRKNKNTNGKAEENGDSNFWNDVAENIVASVVHETSGEPLFTEADIPQILTLSTATLMYIQKEITVLNRLKEDTVKN